MINNSYLFIVGWVDESRSAFENDFKDTNVKSSDDLEREMNRDNSAVWSAVIDAPNVAIAEAIGWSRAIEEMHGSFTMQDTVSLIRELDDDEAIVTDERFEVTLSGIESHG